MNAEMLWITHTDLEHKVSRGCDWSSQAEPGRVAPVQLISIFWQEFKLGLQQSCAEILNWIHRCAGVRSRIPVGWSWAASSVNTEPSTDLRSIPHWSAPVRNHRGTSPTLNWLDPPPVKVNSEPPPPQATSTSSLVSFLSFSFSVEYMLNPSSGALFCNC